MCAKSSDPDRYKAEQQRQWDAVASSWKKWWKIFEKGAQHVSNRLIEMAGVRPGHKVLDIATGIGEPAITVSQLVGPAGHVVATDQSHQMLAIAQDRAAQSGLKNLEFRVVDAEVMDFSEKSFDSILCRWGLMFLPNLVATLARIRQMLVQHGKFATSVLDEASKVPFLSLPLSIAKNVFQMPQAPSGAPSLFGLAGGVLEKEMTQSGFTEIHSEALTFPVEFASVEAYIQFISEVPAPIVAMLASQPEARKAEFRHSIAEAFRQYTLPDGSLRIPNSTICAVGRR